jgi:2-polyprenyl-6-hydroxyphenyl methylase/3-demethylubiquinone-9 3-methyltransferase
MARMNHPAADAEATGSVDPREVARFGRIARAWWDPDGEFRPLHRVNPVRLQFIRDHLVRHFRRDPRAMRPLAGLSLLDIGCGGGLVCEPLARLGGSVTGIDAEAETIAVARTHAAESGVAVDYRRDTAEDLAATGAAFDCVLALEVIEHVADVPLFLGAAARLVRPGGAFIAATINRTAKAFVFAVLGAEYLLRWLPRGTHQWQRFVRPSELASALRREGFAVEALSGLGYDPLVARWTLAAALDVNYLLFASKPAATV